MMRFGFLCAVLAAAADISLVCGTTVQAALIIEPVFNRIDGSGQADNNFPIYDPTFLIDGVAYFTADEPGEIITYASGDPRDPFLDVFHVWNNTQYHITGLTLRLIGTATDTANPGTIVRGPVDAVWGDVNGDTLTGLSDIFATINVSADGKEIRFEDGLIPVGGRFTDIHLAMSDNSPDFAGIDSSFTGILIPEPATLALFALGLALLAIAKIARRTS
ncbi:MAG: PEP-CTERM sorting domain-containing protein [Pirellulales bacterium]